MTPILEVRNLAVTFGGGSRLVGRRRLPVAAVSDVSLEIEQGEVLGLIGESGSGKTSLGRAMLRLVPPARGSIWFEGRDLATLSGRELRALRQRIQPIFQNPLAALNPTMTVEEAVGHPLRIHGLVADRRECRGRVAEALEQVGLTPVESFLDVRPAELSGGQRQRVAIARAIVMRPSLIVADEPVSMLDMSIRSKIIALLLDLKERLDLTLVYITHDLPSAKFVCDDVAIMYLGQIVERGPADAIFASPRHPYTQQLIAAIPDPDPNAEPRAPQRIVEVADAAAPPAGCYFHPRCPVAFEACGWEYRDLEQLLETYWTLVGPEEFERDRRIVGRVSEDGQAIVVAAAKGRSVEDLAALLGRVRSALPEAAFWSGVGRVVQESHDVRLPLHRRYVPDFHSLGDVDVRCHHYGPLAPAVAHVDTTLAGETAA
jgi:peptide/nickel transport system ATP-binding protein